MILSVILINDEGFFKSIVIYVVVIELYCLKTQNGVTKNFDIVGILGLSSYNFLVE